MYSLLPPGWALGDVDRPPEPGQDHVHQGLDDDDDGDDNDDGDDDDDDEVDDGHHDLMSFLWMIIIRWIMSVMSHLPSMNWLEQCQEHDDGNGDVDGDAFLVPQLLQAEGAILPVLGACVLVFFWGCVFSTNSF